MSKQDFKNIFFTNESKELLGEKNSGIIILSVILFLTFVAIGHSVGGLEDLRKSMDNPFTNWVNLPLTGADSKEAINVFNKFQDREVLSQYDLDTVSGYFRRWEKIRHFENRSLNEITSRCIDPGEKLLDQVLVKSNIIHKNENFELTGKSKDCWIVIRESVLNALGYTDLNSVNNLPISITWDSNEDTYVEIFIPVAYVVEELPDRVDMIIPFHLQQLMRENFQSTKALDITRSNNFNILVNKENSNLLEAIPEKIKELGIKVVAEDTLNFNHYTEDFIDLTVYMDTTITFKEKNELIAEVIGLDPGNIRRNDKYVCNVNNDFVISRPHYITFNFNRLDKVGLLKDMVLDTFKLEISMNQVKDKENFSKVSNLTFLISVLLFIFSILSIIVFIYNLLTSHLNKIKMNLGTLKAFGLENGVVNKIYRGIINSFFLKASLYAFGAALFYWVFQRFILGSSGFSLFNIYILLCWLVLYFMISKMSNKLLDSTLNQTPGNLIYNRKTVKN